MTPDTIRQSAERARHDAAEAKARSEYPRHGEATHREKAEALDALADTLDQIGHEPPAEDETNPRESKRARRVYWLRRKAAEKRVESATLRARAHDLGSTRPPGQPIVGSPARQRTQRNGIARMQRVDDAAHHAYLDAIELDRRANAAERNTAIYSDDTTARAQIEAKIAELEDERAQLAKERAKVTRSPLLNYRAPEGVTILNPYRDELETIEQVEMTKAEWKALNPESRGTRTPKGCHHRVRWTASIRGERGPVFLTDSKEHKRPTDETPPDVDAVAPSWLLANMGKEIARLRDRLADLDQREAHTERPARRIGAIEVRDNTEHHKVELWFPSKPDAETRALLKRSGFRWVRSVGCWARGINSGTESRLSEIARHLGEEIAEG